MADGDQARRPRVRLGVARSSRWSGYASGVDALVDTERGGPRLGRCAGPLFAALTVAAVMVAARRGEARSEAPRLRASPLLVAYMLLGVEAADRRG